MKKSFFKRRLSDRCSKGAAFLTAAALLCTGITYTPQTALGDQEEDFPLPFTLSAPEHPSLTLFNADSGVNEGELYFTYNSNTTISSYFEDTEEAYQQRLSTLESLGYDDLWINPQIDWAIDDPEDWHYNEWWDAHTYDGVEHEPGYDEEWHQHLSDWEGISPLWYGAQTTNYAHLLQPPCVYNYTYEEDDDYWVGDEYRPGIRDLFKDGQYTIRREGDEDIAYINYDEHTVYVRIRYIVTVRYWDEQREEQLDHYIFSDWSETASYGKDAVKWQPYTKEDIAPPVISDFHMTDEDFNDYPVVAFTLTVPEEISKAASEVIAHGGRFNIETEGRIKGTEVWTGLQGDWEVKGGNMWMSLVNLVNDEHPETKKLNRFTEVELRCRYWCEQYSNFYGGDFLGEFRTDWSEVITFAPVTLTHEPTGIKVQGIFPADYQLMVEERAIETEGLYKAYDIWLATAGGEKVEIPDNAALQVTIPWETDDLWIVSFDDQNQPSTIKASYDKGGYVFQTNHLGVYGIMEKTIGSGDVNADGSVDIADALMISRYDAALADLEAEQLARGDVSGDGNVDIADALMISRYDAGLISGFGA